MGRKDLGKLKMAISLTSYQRQKLERLSLETGFTMSQVIGYAIERSESKPIKIYGLENWDAPKKVYQKGV